MSNKELIDEKHLTLEEWLTIVLQPEEERKYIILDCQFATDEHLKEYLETIHKRSHEDVKALLNKFLIPCGHLGHDDVLRESLLHMSPEERHIAMKKHSLLRRLFILKKESHPWQGITWIIDLLPHFPQEAINALNAYFQAHCHLMPDGRMQGMSDAEAIIKKKYLEHNLPVKETLLNLTPRDFELLVAYLYRKKGYQVNITPRTRDGGYDIVAEKQSSRELQRFHVECKRYEESVGVRIVRAVLGTLVVKKATKAVIVTSSNFTDTAKKEAYQSQRMELLNVTDFDTDMRKFVDANWTAHVSRYLMELKRTLSPGAP